MSWISNIEYKVPEPSLSRRVSGLDELRGLSILWVFICHGTGLTTWMPTSFSGYGFHGVVLFFLISGYLITCILRESKNRDNYFGRFYINRAFRIWPLMLGALLLSVLVWPQYGRSAVLNLLLVNNYGMAVGIEPPMRTDVMWSLAIEEQFYLFWPVLIWLFPNRQILYLIAIIIGLGLAFDAQLLPGGHMIIHKTTHGNMQYIAMGAAVAFGKTGLKFMLVPWGIFFSWWMAKNGLSALNDFPWTWYGTTFLLGLLVYYTTQVKPFIQNKALSGVGRLCYGLYIIHFFVSALAHHLFGRSIWQAGLFYIVISLLLSMISYRYFELPIQNLRIVFHANKKYQVSLFTSFAFMALASVVFIITTGKIS